MPYRIEKDWSTAAGLRAVVIVVQFTEGIDHHRCGYVGIPETSPLYGKTYGEQLESISQEQADSATLGDKSPILLLTAACNSDTEFDTVRRSLDIIIDCHRGLTYSNGGKESKYPVESDLWWFGFDCAHYGDGAITAGEYDFPYSDDVVRTLEFCEGQCEKIAVQLVEVSK